jgi:nucleotide-binding universal stress UspA family protein
LPGSRFDFCWRPVMTATPDSIKKILCCTDFSENAGQAFSYALDATLHYPGSILYLLHVIPEPESQFWRTYIYDADTNADEKAKRDLDAKVDAEYRSQVPQSIDFRVEFRIGRDYQKILEFAESIQADLLVIGRQGRSHLRAFFFGSVAERVASRAKCPVLVVPLK